MDSRVLRSTHVSTFCPLRLFVFSYLFFLFLKGSVSGDASARERAGSVALIDPPVQTLRINRHPSSSVGDLVSSLCLQEPVRRPHIPT